MYLLLLLTLVYHFTYLRTIHQLHAIIMAPNSFTGYNHPDCQTTLDYNLGFSKDSEDLTIVDTEYVLPNDVTSLDELDLNIAHLNIHGAINKQDSLSRLLTTMGGRNKVNVLSLNETWLHKETESKFSISSYNYIGRTRKGKNGGGLCLLVSEELRFRRLPSLLPNLMTFETISIEVKTKKSALVVVSMYTPPNVSLSDTSSDINKIFNILKSQARLVVVCADHNLDLLKQDHHPKTQEFLEVITDSGFICSITKPTRITHHSATLTDNIFINRFLANDYRSHYYMKILVTIYHV